MRQQGTSICLLFIMEIIPLVRDKERVTYRRKSLGYMMYLEFWISKVQRKKIIRLDNPYPVKFQEFILSRQYASLQ